MANEVLLIANFNAYEITGSVSSSAGGAQIPVKAGPKSFVQVTMEAVSAPLPWTVAMRGEGTVSDLPVTKLPAIAGFGAFSPSGAPGPTYGYLTSLIYPPTA
jgi:hypothetical protein